MMFPRRVSPKNDDCEADVEDERFSQKDAHEVRWPAIKRT